MITARELADKGWCMPLSTLIPAAVFTLKTARNLLHDTQIDKSYKEPLLYMRLIWGGK